MHIGCMYACISVSLSLSIYIYIYIYILLPVSVKIAVLASGDCARGRTAAGVRDHLLLGSSGSYGILIA